ncbi:MAG: hypothetical protein MUC91_09440 [Verrucomicrobia bacterium]|nr:hypothetical protein [Verrucomicrobiota bacterium]
MITLQSAPVVPAHPNIVEAVALLEEPRLRTRERSQLKRILHDTVHLVRKQDGTVQPAAPQKS